MRTTDANGARYVSGYTIVRPRRRAKDKPLTWKDFAPIARLGTTSFVLMKSEIAKWAQLVKQAGIEPE